NPQISGDWMPIDPAMTYRVVTNDFVAGGRDGYLTFGEVSSAGLIEDTFTEYAQGFIDYVEGLTEAGLPLTRLPLEEYSTQSYIGTSGCDHATDSSCEGF
ncbi:MAG: 5'-nucleotidase C-terminal domain-containing protein, partial [Pseudomonadota bacterium]